MIEIKNGNKTTFKIVPDNYEEETGFEQRDLTTSGRHLIGFSDVQPERWNKIFYKKEANMACRGKKRK